MDNEQKKKFADVVINTDKSEALLKVELINIIEEFELPKEIKKWEDIPEGSNVGIIFKALKYLDTNSH